MGNVGEFSLKDRIFLKGYRWRRIDPVPFTPLGKPLSACRLALVSSAGLVLPDQEPFDKSVKGGDYSWREIPVDAEVATLIDTHRSGTYDHQAVQSDPNLAFPLDRARELVDAGRIGSLSRRHVSLMGSITAPGRFVRDTLPEIADALSEEAVDGSNAKGSPRWRSNCCAKSPRRCGRRGLSGCPSSTGVLWTRPMSRRASMR
jgi:D-proline reductase (dithiol) PrdB